MGKDLQDTQALESPEGALRDVTDGVVAEAQDAQATQVSQALLVQPGQVIEGQNPEEQEGRANGQASAATDNSQPDAKRSGTPDLLHEDFMADSKPTASHLLVLPGPLVAQKPRSSGAYSLYRLPQFPPPFLESPPSSSSSVHLCGCWLRNHRARHSHCGLP